MLSHPGLKYWFMSKFAMNNEKKKLNLRTFAFICGQKLKVLSLIMAFFIVASVIINVASFHALNLEITTNAI